MNLPAAHEELDEAVLLFLADKWLRNGNSLFSAEKRKKYAFFAGNAAAQQL